MKQILLFLSLLLITCNLLQAQDRIVARGADAGELYITCFWYGIFDSGWGAPYYDTLRSAVYRITENGKKLAIQSDFDLLSPYNPQYEMIPERILADATPGVVYGKNGYYLGSNFYTQLWVSFDYGENWILRDENMGNKNYYSTDFEKIIYRSGDGLFKSTDYGAFFFNVEGGIGSQGELGWEEEEIFAVGTYNGYDGILYHTYDLFKTYTQIPIDSQYIFGQISGIFPDVFRGGLQGEVYVSSWFPDTTYSGGIYKVSFSADTGQTFRHVYVCDKNCSSFGYLAGSTTQFMSDREPGVFYILKFAEVEDFNPRGLHLKLCIEYYRDYGETLEATFCHDITKNYNNEIGIKEISVNEDILVFPNPTTGELRITNRSPDRGKLSEANYELQITNLAIFDAYGRKEKGEERRGEKEIVINISHLQAGFYFLQITTDKGIITKKIIKY